MDTEETPKKDPLDIAIDDIFESMKVLHADDPQYAKMTKQLTKLYAIKLKHKPERISYDTLAIVLGNIVVAAVIIGYEQKAVITTRAVNFLMRLR